MCWRRQPPTYQLLRKRLTVHTHLVDPDFLRLLASRLDLVLVIFAHLTQRLRQLALVVARQPPVHLLHRDLGARARLIQLLSGQGNRCTSYIQRQTPQIRCKTTTISKIQLLLFYLPTGEARSLESTNGQYRKRPVFSSHCHHAMFTGALYPDGSELTSVERHHIHGLCHGFFIARWLSGLTCS